MSRIQDFLTEKTKNPSFFNNIGFLCPGGSFVTGTQDETSDLDFRAVVWLGSKYVLGMKEFKEKKFVSGEGGINQHLDLDVTVFSLSSFFQHAYQGEFTPFEMLFCEPELILSQSPWFQMVLAHRDWFISKSILFKYSGFVKGMRHKMKQPLKNFRRPDYIERVKRYGYETKSAMKAILIRTLCIEWMQTGTIQLKRPDAADFLTIKQGKYSLSEIEEWLDTLDETHESLLKQCPFPSKPDFQKINSLLVELQFELFQEERKKKL